MDLFELLDNYYKLTKDEKTTTIKELFSHDGKQLLPYLDSSAARGAMRVLADAGEIARPLVLSNEKKFLSLLESDDPKIRMLTAEILGHVGGYVSELIKACRAEQTMFTLPSYILAIGASKTSAAKHYLENYSIRSEIEKHRFEEKQALSKALANFVVKNPAIVRISEKDIILLECPNAGITFKEAAKKGFSCKKSGRYVLISGLKSFTQIYMLRTFSTAYILLGKCGTSLITEKLSSLTDAISERINVKNYRLEISGVSHEERTAYMLGCIAALQGLINTPSAYSFEIKLEINGENTLIMLNPHTDKRFLYRKKAISASISPAVAASVCFCASKYFSGDARVLDNFCGSGTMLFERSFYPYFALTGVDISPQALEAAKENANALKCRAKFFHADALRFDGKEYDEVICNMPFGLRIGSHAKNEKLYDAYIAMLPKIIKKGGHAFLYTHEKQLIEKILKQKHIQYLSKTTFEAGGLYPALYIIEF